MDKQSQMFAVNNNFVCMARETDGSREKQTVKAKHRKNGEKSAL